MCSRWSRPGHHTSLQVWDIGGQSINSKMLSKYISGASVVFFCYDVTEMESFKDMADWVRMVTGYFSTMSTGSMPQVWLLLVAVLWLAWSFSNPARGCSWAAVGRVFPPLMLLLLLLLLLLSFVVVAAADAIVVVVVVVVVVIVVVIAAVVVVVVAVRAAVLGWQQD